MDTTKENNESITSDVDNGQNTTEFISGGTVVKSTLAAVKNNIYDSFIKSSQVGFVDDIYTFLARPSLLGNYDLTSSNAANTEIVSYNLPKDMTGYYNSGTLTGGVAMVQQKLQGFMGMRSDFKIKVVVNANPFQQGLLLIRFVPFTGTLYYEASMWNFNLTTKSQHIRVLLDLSCETEAELYIPFIYCSPFINLVQNSPAGSGGLPYNNLGTVYVTVYSTLQVGTGGATDVEVSIFGSMHNVKLMGPVVPVAQSANSVVKRSVIGIPDKEKGHAGMNKPVVSSAAKMFSASSELLSKIPLVSSFAGPLSWMSRMIDAPAAYFGYAAPVLTNVQTSIQQMDKQYWNNSDQARHAYVMAMASDNAVAHVPGFGGTELDEMSHAYISSRFGYYYTINWSASTASNALIWSQYVAPGYFSTTQTLGSITATVPTPIMFTALNYTYWRGSLIFRFHAVKTKFHSGRCIVCFNPGNLTNTTASLTNFNSNYAFREVIDMREGNIFEITIPYINTDVWSGLFEGGSLAIYCLNPIKYPATAANNFDIIVEVAGGEDFEVSCPHAATSQPFCPIAQSDPCTLTQGTIGSSSVIPDDYTPTAACIGEKVTSVRQYLARYFNMRSIFTATNGYFSIMPFIYSGWSPKLSDGTLQTSAYYKPDAYAYYASCYAMYRGGMHVILDNTGGTTERIITLNDPSNSNIVDITTDYFGSISYSNSSGENYVNIPTTNYPNPVCKVPFYHRNPASLIRGFYSAGNTTLPTDDRQDCHTRVYFRGVGTSNVPVLQRAISDDFSFGFFVSTVPLVTGI